MKKENFNCRITNDAKKGFTLMELMVYVALVGVIVIIAGQVFSDSTKFRVRSESMIRSSETASNIAVLMAEDISQTGAKSSNQGGASTSDVFLTGDSIYIDPQNAAVLKKDSSSFRIVPQTDGCPASGCNTDTLVVRRLRYHETTGEFMAMEEVKWFLRNNSLFRSCRTIPNTSSTASNDCPQKNGSEALQVVEMADNIAGFKVVPAKPRVLGSATVSAYEQSVLLPNSDPSIKTFRLIPRYGDGNFFFTAVESSTDKESATLSGFSTNYDLENGQPELSGKKANQVFVGQANSGSGSWPDLCKKVNLEANIEYEISFSLPFKEDLSRMFCPGRDYAAVGFRNMDGNGYPGLDDFNFFFPVAQNEPTRRTFRFTASSSITNACMAFTFASYSPVAANGSVTISDIQLKKVETSNFNFDDESFVPQVDDKKNVKAFLLILSVKKNGETSTVRQVIPIPSNGPRD